ncbi:MAG: hypothetical protein AAB758_00870 [Patescibacteria group bacterium]
MAHVTSHRVLNSKVRKLGYDHALQLLERFKAQEENKKVTTI